MGVANTTSNCKRTLAERNQHYAIAEISDYVQTQYTGVNALGFKKKPKQNRNSIILLSEQ